MFRTYRHGDKRVMHFTFASLDEFLAYVQQAETAPAFATVETSLQETPEDDQFMMTRSFDEAVKICRFGDHDGFDELMRLVSEVRRALDLPLESQRTFHDYVGFAPDVKAYLEGSPLSMVNMPPRKKRRVALYLNTSCDGSTRRALIMHRGAVALAAAEAIELVGFSVDLHVFEMSENDCDVHVSEFLLKDPDERVNPQKLYFPLCHPSWVRRLNFRLIETTPGIGGHWTGTYGYPAEVPLVRDVLGLGADAIVFPSAKDARIEGENVVEDARRIFALINPLLPERAQLKLR